MDVLVLMSLAAGLRKTSEDPAPITVTREPGGWRVADGRHRAVAAMIAGRRDVGRVRAKRAQNHRRDERRRRRHPSA
jgi:hypothetical protein